MGIQRKVLLASTVLAGMMVADPSLAQTAGNDAGDIVVTARRVEERLQDVPISITVLKQEQLSQRNIVSTADLGGFVPSLSVNQQFGPEKASFVLRGFTQAYHTAPTVGVYFADVVAPRALGPTTSGNGAGVGSMFDLENVQVLKGPQGTLFGRNTTGGAILLVPHRPTDKLEGYVEGTVGNYDERRLQAVLNIPLGDTLKVRAGVDWNKADGYVKNHSGIGPSDFNNTNYIAARLSVLANITADIENTTIGSYSRSDTHGSVPKLATCTWAGHSYTGLGALLGPAACAQVARQDARGDGLWDVENNNPNARELIEQWSVINTTSWQVSDSLKIKNILSYSEYRERADFSLWGDNFSTYPFFPYTGSGGPFSTPAANGPVGTGLKTIQLHPGRYPYTTAQNSFTEELQFQGSALGGALNWQAGAYLEISHPLDWNSQDVEIFTNCSNVQQASTCNPLYAPFNIPGLGFVPVPVGSISDANTKDWFNDKGFYAQATYKLTDKFSVTGGIRYTIDKMRDLAELMNITPAGKYCQDILHFNTAPAGFTVNAANASTYALYTNDPTRCDVTRSIESKRPTWLIDFDYKPNQDMMIYLKWARGYRMGSITSNSIGFETVGPEKLDLYELGAKTSFHGPVSGYFNIAGFYNDFHNQQITINPVVNALYQGVIPNAAPNINAGHSRIWGVEIDSSFRLFPGFTLDVGYTYLNTRVLDITLPTPPVFYDSLNPTAGRGEPLALSPKNTVIVTGTYVLPLPTSVGKVSVGATFSHADANQAEEATTSPLYMISAMNQLNFNVDWHGAFGGPIDLAFYMTNVTNQGRILFPSSSFQTTGADGGQVNQPRMFGFRLKYRFGQ
ncbi:MAG: TonB-dependent receptor [Sphingomonadales bacterium]|nr:TonB-dependent receptor [Sphingomonadales bacterium]